jgi:hypothetical protein
VAWKYFIKEKKLLNKYLNECNYSFKSKQPLPSGKPKSRKENCRSS